MHFYQFQYLLKWKGYRKRTWEPRANLDGCRELLEQFERNQAKRAISKLIDYLPTHFINIMCASIFSVLTDVRTNDGRIEYLIEQKDDMPAAVVPSVQAFEKWPIMVWNKSFNMYPPQTLIKIP